MLAEKLDPYWDEYHCQAQLKPEYIKGRQRSNEHAKEHGRELPYDPTTLSRCNNIAKVRLDGTPYCMKHAGNVALAELLKGKTQ